MMHNRRRNADFRIPPLSNGWDVQVYYEKRYSYEGWHWVGTPHDQRETTAAHAHVVVSAAKPKQSSAPHAPAPNVWNDGSMTAMVSVWSATLREQRESLPPTSNWPR